MSLSLTTRRRLQTSSNKWTSQQHLTQQEPLIRQQLAQSMRKQRSFIDTSSLASGRNIHLQRGLSVGRSQDITNQRAYARQLLKKHSTPNEQHGYGQRADDGGKSLRADSLVRKNISSVCGRIDRSSRSVPAWSSTSSILKSLDKELANLDHVLGKSKDAKSDNKIGTNTDSPPKLQIRNNTKIKTDSGPPLSSSAANYKTNSKVIQKIQNTSTAASNNKTQHAQLNKVNLSIVLSHALNGSKEHDSLLSDQADIDDEEESENSDSEQLRSGVRNTKDSNKLETLEKIVPAQRRRILYQATKQTVLANTNTNSSCSTAAVTILASDLQNHSNFSASPSLTIQKRPPLVRAMSAPVRSYDENSKGSFLANKRKPRRRKLNARTITTCDKDPDDHLLNVKDLNLDSKQKVLQRSRSVAPDVITLVSLISSEGSDSEKEDFLTTTPTDSDCNSPTRRAPTLRKAGKSVSFQENYPPTFQFASKEYSHMLRRGSIAPLAARIKSNRPPTAPPVSIFHNNYTSKSTMDQQANRVANEDLDKKVTCDTTPTTLIPIPPKKTEDEESYQYPDYVCSLKERECWKLYQKMAMKGVNITYDTILRGMLTPTEFRQLQKQRDIEEAKALKQSEELAALEEEQQKPKNRLATTVADKTN